MLKAIYRQETATTTQKDIESHPDHDIIPIEPRPADVTVDEKAAGNSDRINETRQGGTDQTSDLHCRPGFNGGNLPFRVRSAASFTSRLESTRTIPPFHPLEAAPYTATSDTLPKSIPHRDNQYSFHEPAQSTASVRNLSKTELWRRRARHVALSFVTTPVTVAIILGLPCAIASPLKSLFVNVEGWTGTRMPNGPDGKPPLAFIMDTTQFIGGVSIPSSLMLFFRCQFRPTKSEWNRSDVCSPRAGACENSRPSYRCNRGNDGC